MFLPTFWHTPGQQWPMRLLGGRLADIVGESRVVSPALIVCGIGLIILIFANAVQYLILAGLISGAAHGLLYPSLNTMAIRNEAAGHRTKILAIVTGSFDAGIFAGSIGLGQVGKYLGFPAIFLIAGLAFFLGVGIFLVHPAIEEVSRLVNVGKLPDHQVDLLVRVVDAEAESDGPVRHRERYAHGSQHVRRLERSGGAGRTRRCTDPQLIHHEENGLTFDEFKTDVGRVGEAVRGAPIDLALRDAGEQLVFQPVAQSA